MQARIEEDVPGFGAPRPLTADEVLRMVEAGLLADERVELLGGALYPMSPQGPGHAFMTAWLRDVLLRMYADVACAFDHTSFRLDDVSLPEPDLVLCRGSLGVYRTRLPTPSDVVLLVEVSQTSQARDRAKAGRYARAGVPVYWRIDLPAESVVVHLRPGHDGYGETQLLGRGDSVELPELAGRRLAVDALLGD